jgi:hypothetical protein
MVLLLLLQVSSISGSDTDSSDDDSEDDAGGSRGGRKRDGAAAIQGAQAVFKGAGETFEMGQHATARDGAAAHSGCTGGI